MQALLFILFSPLLLAASLPLPFPSSIAFRGTEYTITVKLETDLGVPIENATIYFYHEEQNALLGVSLTNQTGHAVFVWSVPLTHKLGQTSLNATFLGDDERHLLPCFVPIPLTILGKTSLTAEVCDETGRPIGEGIYPDQMLIFAISVLDDQKQPLQGVFVCLLGAENQTIAAGRTAENGTVVFGHRLESLLAGDLLFTARSSGLGYFTGSELQLQYAVEKSPSMFVGLPSFVKTGDQSAIVARLRHEYGDSIPMARIRVLLDGGQVIAETVADEQGRFCYDLDHDLDLIASDRFLVVSYDGDSSHTPTWAVVGLLPASPSSPFSGLLKVVPSTQLANLLYFSGLITAALVGVGSTCLALRVRRATTNVVSH